jgi:hypothetical protein
MHAHRVPRPERTLLPCCPNEMALVLAYSSSPNDYLEAVAEQLVTMAASVRSGEFALVFLSRLGLEKPVFEPTERLGWTLLALLDFATTARRSHDFNELPVEIAQLFQDPAVYAAIKLAVAESERFPETDGLRILPDPNSHAAPFLIDFLTVRASPGFKVDTGWPSVAAACLAKSA